jgi:hypothetical protein
MDYQYSRFSFEFGMKELKERKDATVGFGARNNAFAFLNSFKCLHSEFK